MTGTLEAMLWGLAMLLGLLASAAFAGLETGLYVLNKARLDLRAEGGQRIARRLQQMLDRPQELLTAILLANNAANFTVSTAAVAVFSLLAVRHADLYTTLTIAPAIFVLGEVVPKNIFREAGETLTYRLAWLLRGAMVASRWIGLGPLVTGFSRGVVRLWHGRRGVAEALGPRQRVGTMLAEGYAHGVLTLFQSRMASRVIRIGATTVADVMTALPAVASIPADCSRERFDRILGEQEYSRLPVWRDAPGNVIGIVNVYHVLCDPDPHALPAAHLEEPFKLLDTLDVARALRLLQRSRRALALVINADARVLGIVTIKDLVEEIVGELEEW